LTPETVYLSTKRDFRGTIEKAGKTSDAAFD
jgi:hypothetical protein